MSQIPGEEFTLKAPAPVTHLYSNIWVVGFGTFGALRSVWTPDADIPRPPRAARPVARRPSAVAGSDGLPLVYIYIYIYIFNCGRGVGRTKESSNYGWRDRGSFFMPEFRPSSVSQKPCGTCPNSLAELDP